MTWSAEGKAKGSIFYLSVGNKWQICKDVCGSMFPMKMPESWCWGPAFRGVLAFRKLSKDPRITLNTTCWQYLRVFPGNPWNLFPIGQLLVQERMHLLISRWGLRSGTKLVQKVGRKVNLHSPISHYLSPILTAVAFGTLRIQTGPGNRKKAQHD